MDSILLILILAGFGMAVFPQVYWTGWALSVLPMYFVLFKQATEKAVANSKKSLFTCFKRKEKESLLFFIYRRVLGALGWVLGTILVYWVILPYAFFDKDLIIDNLSEGLSK